MDAQVHDPPGEPADHANQRKGLRALFRDTTFGNGGDSASGVAAAPPTSSGPAQRQRFAAPPTSSGPSRRQQFAGPLTSRPIVSPRLRADPRLRVWISRSAVAIAVFIGFTTWVGWRYGLTAAAVYTAADMLFRSKTAVVIPTSVRITSAQRFTRRRLKIQRPAGYHALNARTIPGTKHVIDHVVVGPAGVFTLDSQRLDRRIPLRMIGGMLYYGRTSMERRLDHARAEAGYAASLIEAELGHPVAVRPAMVTYGPSTSWVIMRVKGVDVLDGFRVGTYFRRQSDEVRRRSKTVGRERLSTSEIEAIIAAAERALPPLN